MYWSYPYGMVSQDGVVSQKRDRLYSEDFLQNNIGKRITAYLSYDSSNQWRDRVFTGTLREVGRDFFVMKDQKTGKDLLLLNINLDYIVFEDQPAVLQE